MVAPSELLQRERRKTRNAHLCELFDFIGLQLRRHFYVFAEEQVPGHLEEAGRLLIFG
jgi:hypothetical protein